MSGHRLHWRSVLDGATIAVLVTLPPALLVRLVKGDDLEGQESGLWVVPVIALVVGFALAGRRAGSRQPDAPLAHAAAAGGVAFVALAALTVIRRLLSGEGVGVPLVVTMLLLAQISVSIAVLGGYVTTRRRRTQ